MQPIVFHDKAEKMGDFYITYMKDGKQMFACCTADLSNNYIAERKPKVITVANGQVALWAWTKNRIIKVNYKDIKRMSPLSSVLKNG